MVWNQTEFYLKIKIGFKPEKVSGQTLISHFRSEINSATTGNSNRSVHIENFCRIDYEDQAAVDTIRICKKNPERVCNLSQVEITVVVLTNFTIAPHLQ